MQNVLKISLDLLDEFPSFPFRVKKDSEFLNLLASISEHGVLQPIIVRQVGDRYQIISGHRRKYVCEILQYDSIPAIVCEFDDPEAILLMLDRSVLLLRFFIGSCIIILYPDIKRGLQN